MKSNLSHLRFSVVLGLLGSLLFISSSWRVSLAQFTPVLSLATASNLGRTTCPLDVYLLMDLTGSMGAELTVLQANASLITSTIQAANPNTRFGVGWFQDYPVYPYGDTFDKPYVRAVDLTFDLATYFTGLNNLVIGNGWDLAESQVPALYQTVTGEGDGMYILPGQQANFRSDAAKVIILVTDAPFHLFYGAIPGGEPPTYEEAVVALQALPRAQVLGIFSGTSDIVDLQNIVRDTGSLAPAGGVDCNEDGSVDILQGEPLVCTISGTGAGLPETILTLVETIEDCTIHLPMITSNP